MLNPIFATSILALAVAITPTFSSAIEPTHERSNITKRGACDGETSTYASNCGVNLDLTKAVPYVRFVLAKTDGTGSKETSLDIKDCLSGGKLGEDSAMLQWHTRSGIDIDALQACQAFILNQIPGPNTSPPFALQVSDSKTYWGVQPKDTSGTSMMAIKRLDPIWAIPNQWFWIHCETAWDASMAGSAYFGKKCLLKQNYPALSPPWRCLSFKDRGATGESTALSGAVELKPCDRQDVSQIVNIKSVYSEFSGTARNFEYKFAA